MSTTHSILRSEAHLPRHARSVGLVQRFARPKRSRVSWAVFILMILGNELRGLYVAQAAWRALFG
jgi:hypothetical protein